MDTHDSARQQAQAYLGSAIAHARESGGRRLPAVRSLAAGAGVSLVTMLRAVAQARRQGLLTSRPGQGTLLRGTVASPAAPALPAGRERWSRVVDALRKDMLNGCWSPGTPLPLAKELAERYGVCRVTLAKALRSLAAGRLVHLRRRRYHVRALDVAPGATVTLVLPAADRAGTPMLFDWSRDALRTLETECGTRGLGLSVFTFDSTAGQLIERDGTRRSPADVRGLAGALGSMLWVIGMATSDAIAGLAAGLLRHGKPVAVWEMVDERMVPESLARAPGIRVFSTASGRSAGRAVGTMLLELGHRAIAYVSGLHSYAWSQQRLTGLCQAFAQAGVTDGVSAFLTTEAWNPDRAVILAGRPDLLRAEHRVRRALETAGRHDAAARSIAGLLDDDLEGLVLRMANARAYEPLYRRALARRDVTAWVLPNDEAAINALGYLRGARVKVPQEISVVGFDDQVGSSFANLATCNFNTPALARAMLAHVTGARLPVGGRGKLIEFDPVIVRRGSVGPARSMSAR